MERYRQAIPAIVGWTVVGVPVVALLLRFGMRALGVRENVPFPGFIYWATDRIVSPFYHYFPADARVDRGSIEVATLAAAGAIFLVAIAAYLIGLWLTSALRGQTDPQTELV
jgi:hypothetical protein